MTKKTVLYIRGRTRWVRWTVSRVAQPTSQLSRLCHCRWAL